MRILLDMDGPLADFDGAVAKLWGYDPAEFEAKRIPGSWCWNGQCGGDAEFWSRITDAGSKFWEDIKPQPWANELIDLVSKITDDWYVVSAPSRHESSHVGKLRWWSKLTGFRNLIITGHKSLMAGKGVLLIDDRESNVAKFIEADGDAILSQRSATSSTSTVTTR